MAKAPKIYKAYRFTQRDPAIDLVLRAIGSTPNSQIEKAGGPRAGTIANWRNHKTRRPQHCTLAAALGAKGKHFVIE